MSMQELGQAQAEGQVPAVNPFDVIAQHVRTRLQNPASLILRTFSVGERTLTVNEDIGQEASYLTEEYTLAYRNSFASPAGFETSSLALDRELPENIRTSLRIVADAVMSADDTQLVDTINTGIAAVAFDLAVAFRPLVEQPIEPNPFISILKDRLPVPGQLGAQLAEAAGLAGVAGPQAEEPESRLRRAFSIMRSLNQKPEPVENTIPYQGLRGISTGDFLSLPPIRRLALMIVPERRNQTLTVLTGAQTPEQTNALNRLSIQVAQELFLDGQIPSTENQVHLTTAQCDLLKVLIGVSEGQLIGPKTVLDLADGNFIKTGPILKDLIFPLLGKIRAYYGADFVAQVPQHWGKTGVASSGTVPEEPSDSPPRPALTTAQEIVDFDRLVLFNGPSDWETR